MPMQNCQQHRQPVLFQPHTQSFRIGRVRLIHQRLYLNQQWPCTLLRDGDAGTGDLLRMMRKEQRGRIADFAQAFLGHGKHAQFIDGTETVLEGANQAEAGVGVAFKIQHGIDDMLQHARACQRAFLGHMADQDHGNAQLFGSAGQLCRALAHLGNRARRRLQNL